MYLPVVFIFCLQFYSDTCRKYLSWFLTISSISFRVEATDYIEAECDFGNVFLIQSQIGVWNLIHGATGTYFSGDSSPSFCSEICYDRISYLTVQKISQKTFPFGLLAQTLFGELRTLRMSGLGVSEFHGIDIERTQYGGELMTLDISHNAITNIPAYAFSNTFNINEIDLSFNEISEIDDWAFFGDDRQIGGNLNMLKVIRLNNNNLTFIDPEWFSRVPNLITLTLNDNFITEIDLCATFSNFFALRTLHLHKNDFSVIETPSQCLDHLESFNISNNPGRNGTEIIKVNAETIDISNTNSRGCYIGSKAVILHADHNQINYIEVHGFSSTKLKELYLNNNEIDSADFLFKLWSVEVIDLSHNALTQMKLNVFENMQNLTTLNISYNKFTTIDFASIESATSLAHLDVSNNLLSGHFNLIAEANALTTLNIANNNYTSVQQNLRKQAPNLATIDLNGNYFDCVELTSTILFMHFDHITPIVPSADSTDYTDHVKGIVCHKTTTISGTDSETFTNQVQKGINYNVEKNKIMNSIDDKLLKLESRLIGIIENVTAFKSS